MKRMRKGLAVLLVFLLGLSTAGCGLLPTTEPKFSGVTEESALGSPYKYHFKKLSDTEKMAYNAILSIIDTFPEKIAIPVLDEAQLERVHTALLHDNPELFFLGGQCTVRQNKQHAYFIPQYIMNSEDYGAMLRKCTNVAAEIVAEANLQMDDFDKEVIVHDRLIDLSVYNDDDADLFKSSIYGVLCGGAAACEGYAKSAKYIFDQLDIPCYVITGTSTPPGSGSRAHMWNVVQIDDAFYHLDLTWDDPVLENGGQVIRYDYFNVTDEKIAKTHTNYNNDNPCTETVGNYFVHEEKYLHNFSQSDMVQAIEMAVENIEKGSAGFQLRFSGEAAYEKAKTELLEKEGIYNFLKQIALNTDVSFATDRVSYVCTDESYCIDIILEVE